MSTKRSPTIGVLGLQGAYQAHMIRLQLLGAHTRLIYQARDLDQVDGVVLPGGESTTMLHFLTGDGVRSDSTEEGPSLWQALQRFVMKKPVLGTCAGLILLAKEVLPKQPSLKALDVVVKRNAYGRQRDSRIVYAESELGDEPTEMVFIRAPMIEQVGSDVEVLAYRDEHPVLVQQDNVIGCAFHPELGREMRVHQRLLSLCV